MRLPDELQWSDELETAMSSGQQAHTLMTMVGLRRSSIGRTEPSCFRFLTPEEDDAGPSSKGVLLEEFNDASDVGVRMPDLGRDASEFRPT